MASPKLSALSAHLQPAVVQHEPHHRSSVLSLARLLTWSSSAPWWSSHQCNKNPLGSWRRNGTVEDTPLAQDELLGDDFSPYPIKNSLMGTGCKGWGGLGSAHTVGPCVSPAQGQRHGWFLCSAGTFLSPSAQQETQAHWYCWCCKMVEELPWMDCEQGEGTEGQLEHSHWISHRSHDHGLG